jgi:hypothetical protein
MKCAECALPFETRKKTILRLRIDGHDRSAISQPNNFTSQTRRILDEPFHLLYESILRIPSFFYAFQHGLLFYIVFIFKSSYWLTISVINYGGAGRPNPPIHDMPDLTHDYMQTGAKALAGNSEYINVKLFDAVDYD